MRLFRPSVAVRLMAGLAVLTLFTVAGGYIAVSSFNQAHNTFNRVASDQVAAMLAAAQLEQKSQALTALAPQLLTKELSQGTLLAFTTQTFSQQMAMQQLIDTLSRQVNDPDTLARVNAASEKLLRNADELSTAIFTKADSQAKLKAAIEDIVDLHAEARRSLSSETSEETRSGSGPVSRWLNALNAISTMVLKSIAFDKRDQLASLNMDMAWLLADADRAARAGADRIEQLPKLQKRLMRIASGPRGVLGLQQQLAGTRVDIDDLFHKNEMISRELVASVRALTDGVRGEIANQNEQLSAVLSGRSRILMALGLAGVALALIIAVYFQTSVIGRLNRLRDAMVQGYTEGSEKVLASGHDEISDMARSVLAHVDEISRRDGEIRQSQERLTAAIESMTSGFSLYDADDRLVNCNTRYRELLYPGIEDYVRPGESFEAIVRRAAETGLIADASGRVGDWVQERVTRHRHPQGTAVQQRSDGTWIEVKERRTEAGDTVAIYSDITERRNFEMRIMAANEEVGEKNRMLEGLSNKLSKYLSPQVYASIFTGEQSVEITSTRKKLTIFFSDIAEFTETTDSLESEELTALLNRYLTEMSRIAIEHGATIDKYIGDAVMAFFGDPETRGAKEDAIACVRMAVAMQKRMRELQSEWRALGVQNLFRLRIGINTGFCTVGNFGSEDRMDYTIIGSEVNLASRLQAHAELGGILLGHETHALVREAIATSEQDPITVKGFAKPVRIYKVLGLRDEFAGADGQIRYEGQSGNLTIDFDDLSQAEGRKLRQLAEQIIGRLNASEAPG